MVSAGGEHKPISAIREFDVWHILRGREIEKRRRQTPGSIRCRVRSRTMKW
jgi:hypothetical protein